MDLCAFKNLHMENVNGDSYSPFPSSVRRDIAGKFNYSDGWVMEWQMNRIAKSTPHCTCLINGIQMGNLQNLVTCTQKINFEGINFH